MGYYYWLLFYIDQVINCTISKIPCYCIFCLLGFINISVLNFWTVQAQKKRQQDKQILLVSQAQQRYHEAHNLYNKDNATYIEYNNTYKVLVTQHPYFIVQNECKLVLIQAGF